MSLRLVWLWFCVALSAPASAQSSLPKPSLTPGAINPAVTQASIGQTICIPGWALTVRPPREFTEQLKRAQIQQYGYRDRQLRDFEEDHLIPIGLGGAPADPRNLWPEPRWPVDGWTADIKDQLETLLHGMVCSGRLTLDAAQQAIARNWHDAYRQAMGDEATSTKGGGQSPRAPVAMTMGMSARPELTCPGDKLVWVNTRTGIYHLRGEIWFGRTEYGRFMCERDADREGNRPAAER